MIPVIYGNRKKEIVLGSVSGEPCSACGSSEHHFSVIKSWFHIFWIPIAPDGRKFLLTCAKCGLETPATSASRFWQEEMAKDPRARFSPFAYTGVGILCAILLAGAALHAQEELDRYFKTKQHSKTVIPGDLYIVHAGAMFDADTNLTDENGHSADLPYTVLRVQSVENNTITLLPGTYNYASVSRAAQDRDHYERAESGYFHDEPFTIMKSKLQEAYDAGSVEAIYRTENRQ